MKISTTDGQEYFLPDYCCYCDMDTGGNHRVNCPYYEPNSPTFQESDKDKKLKNIRVNG